MKVDVYRDFACPWCRLSAHRFERAVTEAGMEGDVELVHRPFRLDPEADGTEDPVPLLDAMAGVFGSRQQAETMLHGMTLLGAAEGVEFRFDQALAVGTLPAHRLMWFAARHYPADTVAALATAVFDAHFRDGHNIADHAELARLAEASGIDGATAKEFLASGEGTAEVREQAAAARLNGVSAVPTYVFPGGETVSGAAETDVLIGALNRARATHDQN
ncbi:DsbA family oxidoreductase [Streptomyces sp. RerS4]|uniref:DsbA family oxidoreductase n=1 Tax=Streptomyces sp. RerS4 TaxID=2942449 RepID=UPI00201BC405|nr:DsbA family oxidoreductase [Streptomyces sp. RerS4]UQX03454.1 DsbA family oxidoreductase [Streptomyces sp. RerS4]